MKKYGPYAFGIIALMIVASAVVLASKPATIRMPAGSAPGEANGEIRLLFVGDIMLSRAIGAAMAERDDWSYPFELMRDRLGSADLAFANLEDPVSTQGTRVGSIYSFRADPRTIAGLVYAGIDVVSLANNHIWDYGPLALEETLAILAENGIGAVGAGRGFAEAHAPVVREVSGTRIAFLGYTDLLPPIVHEPETRPNVAFPDPAQMAADISAARSAADVVIVSFHWGTEYETAHNAHQEALAHAAIDAGADAVIGHHPHVVEDTEEYKGGYIAYSLGNFVFDQNFSEDTGNGLMLEMIIRDKRIASVTKHRIEFTPTYQPFEAGR